MFAMSVAEFVMWAILAFLFWKRGLRRRFPVLGAYLILHVAAMPFLMGTFHLVTQPWGRNYFPAYYLSYWGVYVASAALIFLICIEVFRSALKAFPGIARLGTVIFRWAAVASVVLTFSTVSFSHKGLLLIPDLGLGIMRSVSILELFLLAFLCFSMNALRLNIRDMAFGIALGLGMMACNDLVAVSLLSRSASLTSPLQMLYEGVLLAVMGVWAIYFALPEPAAKLVVVPVNSTIYRWNEIASALGHPGTQVATQQPANGFFLSDVERVVEKVLNKNLQNRESEL